MVSIVEGGGNEIGRSFWFYDERFDRCFGEGDDSWSGAGACTAVVAWVVCFAENLNRGKMAVKSIF